MLGICGQIAGAQSAVVVQRDVIDLCALEDGGIARLHLGHDIALLEVAHVVAGVLTVGVHLKAVVGLEPVVHPGCPYVLRFVGQGVGAGGRNCRGDLAALHQLVAGVDSQSVGEEHVVVHLGTHPVSFPLVIGVDVHAVVDADHQILLVDDLPVFDAVAKGTEADPCIALKGVGAVAAFPAVVLLDQRIGQVEVVQGD